MAFSTTPTEGADRLRATAEGQTINALGGNDWIRSTFSGSTLYGGLGHDRISVALSPADPIGTAQWTAALFGGNGNDWLVTDLIGHATEDASANFWITQSGGRGNDNLRVTATSTADGPASGGIYDIDLYGGAGNDSIWIETSGPSILGQNFVDAGSGSDVVYVYADSVADTGFGGNDVIAGSGDDDVTLFAYRGSNTAQGDAGNDRIEAVISESDGANVIDGGAGDDTLIAEVIGGAGRSNLYGSAGDDVLRVYGGDQNYLTGGAGDDTITGGSGADRIVGGAGADMLRGGGGDDVFVYLWMTGGAPETRDTIRGFASGEDVIDLSAIDANANQRGNQAFTFGDVTGLGRAWVEESAAGVVIRADNGGAEHLYIAVDGVDARDWTADDFLL